MSYIVARESVALQQQDSYRKGAIMAGKNLAIERSVARNQSQLVERLADYPFDFVPAATRAGLAGWLTMPLLVVGTAYSVFADNVPAALTPQVPTNAVWIFYGVHVNDLAMPVSHLFFGIGAAANRKGQFDLQPLYTAQSPEGFFSTPIVYGPQDIVTCTVRCSVVTGLASPIVLDTLVIELEQNNLV